MENLLLKKLQIKSGFKVAVLNAPNNFDTIIGNFPEDINFASSATDDLNALLIFAITKVDLHEALEKTKQQIDDKTIVWILYPKAKTKLAADLNLMQSSQDLNKYNLTPCASAAIDATWTAIRIKTAGTQKKSGVGNSEIQRNEYGSYVDVNTKTITLPEDLRAALEADPAAINFYETLSYSNRKEYVLWILTAKQEKTRSERIQKSVAKLLAGKKNPNEKLAR